jgi:hypothetical protein
VIEGKGTTTPPVSDPVKVEQGSGDNVTITATPDEGYEFIGWEIDGDYTLPEGGSLTDPTLVIKPGSDVHAHAKFRKKAVPTEPSTEAPTEVETQKPSVTPTQPAGTTTPSATTPQTGDFTHNLLWILLAIGAFVALIVLFFVYRKVRKREKADN